MDYSIVILSVCSFVESHVKLKISHAAMAQAIGYSYPQIRKVFRECMQIPLSKYIRLRRIHHAAFDIIHTDKSLLSIALEYGFNQYDTFTRAFKRETGLLPTEFRRMRAQAGRRLITSGVYAPAILDMPYQYCLQTEEFTMDQKENGSCILMGVPKVEYKREECTPFPACLKSCLNYMGQDIRYADIMAASGAAFRLRWSKKFWDGGNVDITYIYEDETEAFRRALEAAGRSYCILRRAESQKQDFIHFIQSEIKAGRPVIALGIIGPPEACIITGYADNGETLKGWNFFQHRPEYNKGIMFDENGYFVSSSWWENADTCMLMSIGEARQPVTKDKDILKNALKLVNREPIIWPNCDNEVACGQEAYKTWAEWTSDDREFGESCTLPLLWERFMCQTDAQAMIGEGRWYAAEYLKEVAIRYPEVAGLCRAAAERFYRASDCANTKMNAVLGIHDNDADKLKHYAKPETRRELAKLIQEAARYEQEAMRLVEEIIAGIQ